MKKSNNIIFLIIFLLVTGCASKEAVDNVDESQPIFEETGNNTNKNNQQFDASNPFYPLKQSIYDIENDINELKSKVIEYESKLHNPGVNIELLKMIKAPQLKHEIILTNGTIIQGSIISENTEKMIVQTQIGQLTIEKELVIEIKEIDPLMPEIIFIENTVEERIDNETYTYIGDIKNIGGVRADFVRIIYHFWADDTSPILSDSVYIDGNNHVYLNGVISDANIGPMEFGKFSFTINLPDSLDIEYHTKEIKWDTFN